jgi:hypothetical protein
MNKFCIWLVLLEASFASAQVANLTVHIDAKDGFDTYLSTAVVISPVKSKLPSSAEAQGKYYAANSCLSHTADVLDVGK